MNEKWNKKWLILIVVLAVILTGVILMKQTRTEEKIPALSEQAAPTETTAAVSEAEQGAAGITITLEAEDGELSGVTKAADANASGGSFVEGFDSGEDNLRFTIKVDMRGTYMISIRYKTFGGDKPNFLALNGERLAEYNFKDTAEWKDAVIGQYDLNAGTHTFDISTSWGWIGVDYIQLTGGPGGPVNHVSLVSEGQPSGPSDAAVSLVARADNSAEYRYFAREKNGEWIALNDYSRHPFFTWLPPAAAEYELKVMTRGLDSKSEKQAEAIVSYMALPSYMNKPLVNPMFGDHMVIQRETEAAIWGWAEPSATVTVEIDHKIITGIADADGKWKVNMGIFSAGGPHAITVSSGSQTTNINDVLFGDVWLSSGQSNMEFRLPDAMNAEEEIKQANIPAVRFMKVPQATSPYPLSMMSADAKWQITTSESVADQSAVAYFFAKKLNKETNVPIGILFSAVGGTKAESWMSYNSLQKNPEFMTAANAVQTGATTIETAKSPIALFNGMIAPLAPYQLKGVLWYQGESNWGEHRYNKLLPDLMEDWRSAFLDQELPFIIIQISAFGTVQSEGNPAQAGEGLPEVREAQLRTVQNDKHACLVVTTDVGNSTDIHPTNKQDVGARAAICALGKYYDKDIEYSGPIYKSMAQEGNSIRIQFDHANHGLIAGMKDGLQPVKKEKSGKLIGFAIADSDKRYYAADAVIDGSSVLISSEKVSEPIAVRYGWSDSPTTNLYNKEGLPASPFRTDSKLHLYVASGKGGGVYDKDTEVVIIADPPAQGMKFDSWIGDTDQIIDVHQSETTIKLADALYTTIAPKYVGN